MIRVVLDGAPVGKGRPRFVRSTGRVYTPGKTVTYEGALALAGQQAMRGQQPLRGPITVHATAYMPIPMSWPRRKILAALEGSLRPGRPDADNLLKVLDALNGVVWHDDAQIAEARISKLYDPDPRLEVEVYPLGWSERQ